MSEHTVELQQIRHSRTTHWQWVCECGESDDNPTRQGALDGARQHIDSSYADQG